MPRSSHVKPLFLERFSDDLTRIVWMGLDGRGEDLARYLQRVIPRWEQDAPELAKRLEQLLEPKRSSPVRRAPAPSSLQENPDDSLPTGISTGDFLSVELEPSLPVEPIWSTTISDSLHSLIRERSHLDILAKAGLTPTRTVVFTGPPGVGKTLAARWLARELNLPLAVLNLGTVMSSFLGRTGSNLRHVMEFARSQPCVLLFDELDAIAKRRDDQSDIGELKRLVTVLLQELDSWPSTALLVATTNHEQLIDPAVWRRFQERLVFPLPEKKEQLALLKERLGSYTQEVDKRFLNAAAEISTRISQAELTLITERALRDHLLATQSLLESLESNFRQIVGLMPLSERKIIGESLSKLKLGQREIHRLTGLARETLRKRS